MEGPLLIRRLPFPIHELDSFEQKLIQQNVCPSVDQRVGNIPRRQEANLQALEGGSGHQAALPVMCHPHIGEQVTFEFMSLEFQE